MLPSQLDFDPWSQHCGKMRDESQEYSSDCHICAMPHVYTDGEKRKEEVQKDLLYRVIAQW